MQLDQGKRFETERFGCLDRGQAAGQPSPADQDDQRHEDDRASEVIGLPFRRLSMSAIVRRLCCIAPKARLISNLRNLTFVIFVC
jgi:hypothetical protein